MKNHIQGSFIICRKLLVFAAVMRVPVLLYAEDYGEYERERGKLLWNLRELPFPLAQAKNNEESHSGQLYHL